MLVPKGSIAKVGKYYFSAPQHKTDVQRAFREFFDQQDLSNGESVVASALEEGLFNEWFLYDFILSSGETPLAHFVAKNPLKASKSEIKFYRELSENNIYGMFEVKRVDVGAGLEIENVKTRVTSFVREQQLTYQVKRGDAFFARIGRVLDHDELVGADTFLLEGIDEKFKRMVRKGHLKLTPKIACDLLH